MRTWETHSCVSVNGDNLCARQGYTMYKIMRTLEMQSCVSVNGDDLYMCKAGIYNVQDYEDMGDAFMCECEWRFMCKAGIYNVQDYEDMGDALMCECEWR